MTFDCFSGHQNQAIPKECVLIIDRETGEITLERLSSQLLVKKTRPEKQEKPPQLPSSSTVNPPSGAGRGALPKPTSTVHQTKPPKKVKEGSPKPAKSHPSLHLGNEGDSSDVELDDYDLWTFSDSEFQVPRQASPAIPATPLVAPTVKNPVPQKFLPTSNLSSDSSSESSSSDR